MELEQTDALRKFFSGEITQEIIDEYDLAQAEAIARRLQERKAERSTLRYQVTKFLGLKPAAKQNGRKR